MALSEYDGLRQQSSGNFGLPFPAIKLSVQARSQGGGGFEGFDQTP